MFTTLEARKLLLNTYRILQRNNRPFNKENIIKHAKHELMYISESNYIQNLKTLNFVIEKEWDNIFKGV